MGQRIVLSENEKLNIRKMYGIINENTQMTGCTSGNCKNGIGVYTWPSGSKYEGEWVDGYRDGIGVYTWPSGNKYEGEWVKGNMDGEGIMKDKHDNVLKQGTWVNDKFKRDFNKDCKDNFNKKYENSFDIKDDNNVVIFNDNKYGDYYCTDENTINLTHFNYDSIWDYRLTLDTSGVKKVLTKKREGKDWIDVTNDKKYQKAKDAIIKNVFNIP